MVSVDASCGVAYRSGNRLTQQGVLMISRTSIRVAALCFTIAWPFAAHAQEVSISGTITDATDAALPGVTVTALHVDTGNTFAGVTDTAGQYRIGAMRPGMYRIAAELAGFVSS